MHLKHIPQLDGLRGFAVLLVLLAHSSIMFTRVRSLAWLDGYGSLGVQLFFVLSGFLITRILLDSKDDPHYFRNFFVRRALRIYPLYYALLGFVVFSGLVQQHGVRWWPYTLYVSNLVYGENTQPSPLGPVWSLAVEEQFYLLWPIIVSILSRRNLERFCLAMIIGAICLRFNGILQCHNTLLQLDALGGGALVACRFDRIASWRPLARFVGCLLPLGVSMPLGFWNNLSQTVQVVSSTALLIVLLNDRAVISQLFRAPAMRYLGRISYGVYLLHSLVFSAFLWSRFGRSVIRGGSAMAAVLWTLGQFVVVLAVASASYYLFESRFLRLKRYFEQERPRPQASSDDRRDRQALTPTKVVEA